MIFWNFSDSGTCRLNRTIVGYSTGADVTVHQELMNGIGKADKIWHLSQAALVKGLSTADLQMISRLSKDRVFSRGEVIFEPGKKAESLYFLNRGSVRLSMSSDDNREKTIGILRGGDIFGLESVSHEGLSRVQAVAHEESWVSALTREQFLKIAVEHPVLSFNLIQILLHRLADARDDIKALCFMDIQQRLVQALLKLARTHGQKLVNQQHMVKLSLRLSHDYLAALIASNRPYLSNIMSSFKKQGWIAYRRSHLLINVEALKALEGRLPID